jgi:hypothetical protein
MKLPLWLLLCMLVDLLQFIVFVAFFVAFRSGYNFACWWIYYRSLFLLPFFLPSEVAITLHAGGFTTVHCFCCLFFCLQKWLLLCMLVDLLHFPAFVLVTSKCRPRLECSILCDGFARQLIRLKLWWASRTGLNEVVVDLQSFAVT